MILLNDFPRFQKIEWGASDTETLTYIDEKIVTDKELNDLVKKHSVAWFRQHTSVRVWAWQFSDGEHFFVSNDFDEYLTFLCEHKVKAIWFYNAKFDFAQIDYQILTHNPPFELHSGDRGKAHAFSYESLHNDKGARFSLKCWYPYRARGKGSKNVSRHEHVHSFTFYDFCNIFGGGLKNLLEEFNVIDFNGEKIRKSNMDYQAVDEKNLTLDEIKYLENDTKGLYHLIRISNETLENLTGFSIVGAKPDIMTAGGLAKKVLLKFLYPNIEEPRERVREYQKEHRVTADIDLFFRARKLYAGGLCFLNQKYTGELIRGKKMFRYDVNSEYPFIMSRMPDVYGLPKKYETMPKIKPNKLYIVQFMDFYGEVKKNMLPCFRNPFTGDYEAKPYISEPFCMFLDEFNELSHWYDFETQIEYVYEFNTRENPHYNEFVQNFYKLKNETKKTGEKAKNKFAKLLLNSSYGKLAERILREITVRELNEETNAVHLVRTGETELDDSGILSVIQGALVTSMAHIWILSHIREICGNVAENFVYCDTDSVHCFCEYPKANAFDLGAFKNEGCFNAIKYIAPKCYFDGKTDENGVLTEFEAHTKGLSTRTVMSEFATENGFKPLEYIDKRFSYGEKYTPLSGMNVKGGKALLPLEKYLAKPLSGDGLTLTAWGLMDL